MHPPWPSQRSTVQASLSLHGLGPGIQVPLTHWSGFEQEFPSQDVELLLTCVQRLFVQASSVQALLSLHSAAVVHWISATPMLSLKLLPGAKSIQAVAGCGTAR